VKFGSRIFFAYLAVFFICFAYPLNWVVESLRARYLEGVEDTLVDQANTLAAVAGVEMAQGGLSLEELRTAFSDLYSRDPEARIYKFQKTGVDMMVYITDERGRVIFHSTERSLVGEDFSEWRDVALTLEGDYGARTSRSDPDDPLSSVLHVAAPIRVEGEIAGVLTVAKPTTNINSFIREAKPRIIRVGIISLSAAVVLGLLVSAWFARPIRRLTRYAEDIRRGRRVPLPRLGATEIGEMGHAFERMKDALEGKKYVEQYVKKLTHEIKSPLSAICGAAELLEEEMEPGQRRRFLENIRGEAARIQLFVDRMLALSGIESIKNLEKTGPVSLATVIETVLESKAAILSQKEISLVRSGLADAVVKGDPLLLHQALSNLVGNALDFTPHGGRIEVSIRKEGRTVFLRVADNGCGIPDYAKDKVFDPFFSLKRPDSGKKSSGVGLNIAKEVAVLHGGSVGLENRSSGGAAAALALPASAVAKTAGAGVKKKDGD
jgi:two-component system sensor histidine kinase CreC